MTLRQFFCRHRLVDYHVWAGGERKTCHRCGLIEEHTVDGSRPCRHCGVELRGKVHGCPVKGR